MCSSDLVLGEVLECAFWQRDIENCGFRHGEHLHMVHGGTHRPGFVHVDRRLSFLHGGRTQDDDLHGFAVVGVEGIEAGRRRKHMGEADRVPDNSKGSCHGVSLSFHPVFRLLLAVDPGRATFFLIGFRGRLRARYGGAL